MSTMTEARPQVEFDQGAYPDVCDAYRHEDGSITYIVFDNDGEHANPRECDGNVATLIQENDRCIDIDSDDAGLGEAHKRWRWLDQQNAHISCVGLSGKCGCRNCGDLSATDKLIAKSGLDRQDMVRRYLAIFRPDILYYCGYWGAGRESYGWGYITREAWEKWMYPEKPYVPDGATPEEAAKAADYFLEYQPTTTPEEAFKQEVDLYNQWASGEVYGAYHVSVGEPIVVLGEEGAYIDGYKEDEDSCWGFLGYDDHKDITQQFTDSPVTEVLY